jgi:pyruvate carboxylase subunit B
LSCLAAAEAGASSVDAALSPFSGGASQPPTETLVGAMQSTSLDPRLDLGALADLAGYFSEVLEHYRPLLNPRSLQTDPGILVHQVPGGMLSNLLSQLKDQDSLGRLTEVLAEIPRVRADLGYPPLVTPTSQIVGIQAVLNVLTGSRYRDVTREVRDYVRGVYGAPPGPIDPALSQRILAAEPAVTGRPADRLPPELAKALDEVRSVVPAADRAEALSYALFPMIFRSFVASRSRGLNWETLTSAGLGVVGALRSAPASRPTGAPARVPPARSAWSLEGRSRSHAQGGWVREGHGRTRR